MPSIDISQAELSDVWLANFRPFGRQVELSQLGAVNIIAGPNNVGKSALLLALRRLTRMDSKFVPRIGVPDGAGAVGGMTSFRWHREDLHRGTERPISRLRFTHRDEFAVIGAQGMRWPDEKSAHEDIDKIALRIVFVPPSRIRGTKATHHDPTSHEARVYNGEDVLADLLRWHLPSRAEGLIEDSRRGRVEAFATQVLGEKLSIWPATDPLDVLVRIGTGMPRSWTDLGDGVAHVIGIAMALASVDRPILLLEEPEIGLHPRVQRNLVRALAETPDTMSFVTTHSNHLIDEQHTAVRVYQVAVEDGARTVRALDRNRLALLSDLGIRPSSVAQANAVIWVEGPSDITYLRRWLALKETRLMEGVDYTFAMFGGSLLAHIEWGENEGAEKLVQLMGIHPNSFLIADSDRRAPDDGLHKPYLRAFLKNAPKGRTWVTQHREVESCLTDAALCSAFGLERPTSPSNLYDSLENRLLALGAAKSRASAKPELALKVVPHVQASEVPPEVDELLAFLTKASESVLPS